MLKIKGFFIFDFIFFKSVFTVNINTNKIVSLVGESGSGKTTFLRCIAGLLMPKASYLNINGKVLQNSKKKIFINPYFRNIGYVFQNGNLYSYMSVFENITFALNKAVLKDEVQDLMNYLNLNKIKKRSVDNLSGGEKQRILIAQVLLSKPKLVLLDEVLSNQDLNMRLKLISLFKTLSCNNMSFIYVSHDIKNVEDITDYIIYLNKGKVLYQS